MAGTQPTRRIIRRRPVEEVEEVAEEEPEEIIEDDGAEIEDDDDDVEYIDDDEVVDDDAEEVVEEEQPHRVPRRIVSAPVTAKKAAPPAPPAKKAVALKGGTKTVAAPPAKKVAAPAPVAKKVAPVAAEAEAEAKPVKIQKADAMAMAGLFEALLDNLNNGQAIIISRVGEERWQVASSDQIKGVSVKLTGTAYWDKVLSPEYSEWQKEWEQLSYEEKKAQAKKLKAKWEAHADQRVDQIRIAQAVMDALGIEKYKPEFRTRASRESLHG